MVSGENVAMQHWTLVYRMTLDVKKRKRMKAETRTKWWKLKKEECCAVVSSGRSRHSLGGREVLPDDWKNTTEMVRERQRRCLVYLLEREKRTRRLGGGLDTFL